MNWLTAIKETYKGTTEQRAISHRPQLAGRVHLMTGRDDDVKSEALNDYTDFASVAEQHVWLRRGLKIMQDNFAMALPGVVYKKEHPQAGEPVKNHPVTDVLNYCNDEYGPTDHWKMWIPHMVLGGEGFTEFVSTQNRNKILEMWARRPDKISIIPDASRPTYPTALGYRWTHDDDNVGVRWEAGDMIQWKFYNPLNHWRGLPLITAVRHGIIIDVFSQAWSKKFLKSGGNPDWALITPQGITETEKDALYKKLDQKFLGWENWHQPIILEEGIYDIKPLSFAPKDMQWLEQRKIARDEIAAIFGIPDILMGFGDDSYDTEEKRTAALRMLWQLTLLPLVKFRDNQLTSFFTRRRPLLKPGQVIESDLTEINVIQEDITPKIEQAKSLWSMGVPFNVLNERLSLGIGEIEGGDQGYLPLNLLPTSEAYEPPAPMAGSPLPAPTEEAPPEEEPPPEEEQRAVKVMEEKAAEYGSIEHRAFMARAETMTRPFERRMVRELKRYFQRQQNEIGRAFRSEMEGRSTSAEQKQEAPATLPPVDELLDWEEEGRLLEELMRPIVLALMLESGQSALDLVLGAGEQTFNENSFQLKQAIEFILDEHSRVTNNTTFRELTSLFQQAGREGSSIPAIQDMLSEFFGGRKSAYQTERIARTTMIASHNAASLQAYADSGVVYGTEWYATLDNRVRDTHRDAHGQFKPLGGRFEVGAALLRFPGDPAARHPEETINCRCTQRPFTKMP